MEAEKKSICFVEAGQEPAASRALGGSFQIEDCGLFGECKHKVEYFDFSSGKEDYVEVLYCATNYWYVAFAIAFVLLLVFLLLRKLRRPALPAVPAI